MTKNNQPVYLTFVGNTLSRLAVLVIVACTITGCSSLPDWTLASKKDGVEVYLKDVTTSPIPAYKGTVDINASISQVMMVLTNFSRYPEWVYQCESVDIIEFVSYSEAYLYQVTSLPVITDRDIILHSSIISSDDSADIVIELNATPQFCTGKDTDRCEVLNKSSYVRVEKSQGTFRLTPLATDKVRVTWEQHVDPAGLLPGWLVRLMLADVPMKSLHQLKMLVEGK